jgi:hypothetical protein
MKLESNDEIPGEPDEGWQGAPRLYSNEILTLSLCRYTGNQIFSLDEPCPAADLHPAGSCAALYHSATALQRGEIDVMQYPADVPVREVRASNPSDDPIATTYE